MCNPHAVAVAHGRDHLLEQDCRVLERSVVCVCVCVCLKDFGGWIKVRCFYLHALCEWREGKVVCVCVCVRALSVFHVCACVCA